MISKYIKVQFIKLKLTISKGFSSISMIKLCLYSRALVNDIAIAIVSGGDLPFSRSIRPACLPYDYVGRDYETFRDDPSIVGWGATRNNGGASDICRQVMIKSNNG